MVLGIDLGRQKKLSKKQERSLAKLLLSGHGCIDCEKCQWHYIIMGGFKNEVICAIKEGTPEKGICRYWEEKIKWPRPPAK